MREQSHIDAMRDAIRGDLERARERRPSIFERPAPPPVEIRHDQPPAPSNNLSQGTAGPQQTPEPVDEPVIGQEPMDADEPVVAEEPAVAAETPAPAPRRRLRFAFWRR